MNPTTTKPRCSHRAWLMGSLTLLAAVAPGRVAADTLPHFSLEIIAPISDTVALDASVPRINQAGCAIGNMPNPPRAYLWKAGQFWMLPPLPGDVEAVAHGLSELQNDQIQ